MVYRLALVEYLNTYPFSEGMRLSGFEIKAEIHRVTPALCARLFLEGKVDISLCPVGALDEMPDHEICGQYCVGADGEVGTVLLLSQVPIEQIAKVKLDNHSRTSNLLLQILAKHHWKKDWTYYFESPDKLPETCVMIGDKVFEQKKQFNYTYDLAEAWKSMTGLPMVFALWIAKPHTPRDMIQSIDESFELGIASVRDENSPLEQWQKDYLLNCISYPRDEAKMEALRVFQSYSQTF